MRVADRSRFTRPVTWAEYQGRPTSGRWTSMSWLEPRDRAAAGRTLAVVALVAAGVTVGWEVLGLVLDLPVSTVQSLVAASAVGSGLLVISILAASAPDRMPTWAWAGAAVIGVLTVVWVAFVTGDTSVSAQVGLIYPVVFAAANLRAGAAWGVTGLAVVVDAAVVTYEVQGRAAVPIVAAVASALLVITAVLQMTARHQDALTARLSEIAAVDQLTGLASRRRLEEVADEVLATGCLPGDFSLGTGLAIIDLDHFKTLNDTYGHPVGDAALVHVAALLRATCPSRATVARLGGDELAVLLPCGRPEELGEVMERFRAAVRSSPMNHLGRVLALSTSVGVAHLPSSRGPSLATLYAAADEALYQAKLRGRGRVVVA